MWLGLTITKNIALTSVAKDPELLGIQNPFFHRRLNAQSQGYVLVLHVDPVERVAVDVAGQDVDRVNPGHGYRGVCCPLARVT